jgi:hypothetical protein
MPSIPGSAKTFATLSRQKKKLPPFGLSTNEERNQFIEHFWCAAATCEH